MIDLEIRLAGHDNAALAEAIEQFLGQEFAHQPRRTVSEEATPAEKKADPVAVAALILSIPAALLAATDLAERVKLRDKVARLIDLVRRTEEKTESEALVETPTGPRLIAAMSADELLELALQAEECSP